MGWRKVGNSSKLETFPSEIIVEKFFILFFFPIIVLNIVIIVDVESFPHTLQKQAASIPHKCWLVWLYYARVEHEKLPASSMRQIAIPSSTRQLLTLCSHESFLIFGFAWMWHSKYKSSPSLMSSLDKVEPSWILTKGGSANEKRRSERVELKSSWGRKGEKKIENIHHNMMMEKVGVKLL